MGAQNKENLPIMFSNTLKDREKGIWEGIVYLEEGVWWVQVNETHYQIQNPESLKPEYHDRKATVQKSGSKFRFLNIN